MIKYLYFLHKFFILPIILGKISLYLYFYLYTIKTNTKTTFDQRIVCKKGLYFLFDQYIIYRLNRNKIFQHSDMHNRFLHF